MVVSTVQERGLADRAVALREWLTSSKVDEFHREAILLCLLEELSLSFPVVAGGWHKGSRPIQGLYGGFQ